MDIDKGRIPEIILDDLNRGRRLTEQELARKLGVGRTPLREQLRHLEEEGIIRLRQRQGISLRNVTLREVMEIHDLRMILEGFACRLLAARMNDDVLRRLSGLARDYREETSGAESAPGRRRKIDVAFHQLIVAECGNRQLKRILDRFHLLTYSFMASANALDLYAGAGRQHTHEDIVAALETGVPDEAEQAVRQHIQKGKEDIVAKFLGPLDAVS